MSKKRGQIALTLTWFTAFLVIFFIMLLFVGFSSVLAGKKVVSGLFGGGFSSIDITTGKNILEMQGLFFVILNTPTEDGKTIKDLILMREKEIVEEEVKNIFEKRGEKCYLFEIDYSDGESILVSQGMQKYKAMTNIGGRAVSSDNTYLNIVSGIYRETIFLDNQEINVIAYSEKC